MVEQMKPHFTEDIREIRKGRMLVKILSVSGVFHRLVFMISPPSPDARQALILSRKTHDAQVAQRSLFVTFSCSNTITLSIKWDHKLS